MINIPIILFVVMVSISIIAIFGMLSLHQKMHKCNVECIREIAKELDRLEREINRNA